MRKILALLITFSMVLAGCMDLTDEDVESIVDSIVDLPACNDETAYNYDENATNNLACLTEQILKQSVTDFVNLVDNGPGWNETTGLVMEGSETDSDGMTSTFTNTMATSPDGIYVMTVVDMGMMVIEIGELMTENPDGTTNFVVTWMGNTFQMNSAGIFSETWNEQNYLEENNDDSEDEMDNDFDSNDMSMDEESEDGDDDDSGADARSYHDDDDNGNSDGMDDGTHDNDDAMDDHDDDHGDDHDDHDDDMGDDMSDDFDMGLPDTDVSIPEGFDPATAMFELGLATANGYSFSTTLDDSMGHSVTMTFTLSLTFEVTQLVMVETTPDGMSSTSSITILDTDSVEALLTNDDTLMHHALPFILQPMGDNDHDGHDGDDGHDDHEGHEDHDDHEGHDDHGDHGDHEEEHFSVSVLFFDNTTNQYEVDLDDYGYDYASGWNASTEAFYENNISFGHTTYECCGHYINSIAGVDEPTDGSWYWAVYVWNHTTEDWEMSPVGVDGIVMDEVEHIAFAPSAYSTDTIPSPEEHQEDHEGHDGDDDHEGHDDHDGHDDHEGHDDHDGHDHHGHGPAVDWMIDTADMMSPAEVEGSFADYHIVLANCTMDSEPDEDGSMEPTDMVETNAMTCGDDVLKISIADATAPGADVMFHDADGSGTITQGDMVHINPDFDAGGEWNMVRLYSNSSDKYSDENPMLPGFGAAAGIIALLSAALIARRD